MITKHFFYILESRWTIYVKESILEEDHAHSFKKDEIGEVKKIYIKQYDNSYYPIDKVIYLGSEDFKDTEDLEERRNNVLTNLMDNERVQHIVNEDDIFEDGISEYILCIHTYHLFIISNQSETILQYDENDIIEHNEKNKTILVQESTRYGDANKYKYIDYEKYLGSLKCSHMHLNDEQFKKDVLKLIKEEV